MQPKAIHADNAKKNKTKEAKGQWVRDELL